MHRARWIIGSLSSALVAVGIVGVVGIIGASGRIMAPPAAAQVAAVVRAPAPAHDPTRPTIAVVLGETRTEATDFLAPYGMFVESGAYNVYAVAASPTVRTLAGGVDVVPQLTFAELDARLGGDPDVIVVPAIKDVEAAANAPVLEWIRQHRQGGSMLFAWCAGAQVLAASGVVDGREVTTHWTEIDGFESAYPAVTWRRGVRYVDGGDLLTTAGITSGVDATLHFMATRNSRAVADRVAQALHYPGSAFLADPTAPQYAFEPVDAAVYLHMAFDWSTPASAVWLYDGVGEVDLAAVVEAFGLTGTDILTTVAPSPSVTTQHGLQLVARRSSGGLGDVAGVFVPGGRGAAEAARGVHDTLGIAHEAITVVPDDQTATYAFTRALQELAARRDVWTAEYAARQLEVRSDLRLAGPRWPLDLLLAPIVAGIIGAASMWGLVRLVQQRPGKARTRVGGERMPASDDVA